MRTANNVPRSSGTSNKSFNNYSLKVNGEGRQRDAPNGRNSQLNGRKGDSEDQNGLDLRGYS
jgi:hypothetical protein